MGGGGKFRYLRQILLSLNTKSTCFFKLCCTIYNERNILKNFCKYHIHYYLSLSELVASKAWIDKLWITSHTDLKQMLQNWGDTFLMTSFTSPVKKMNFFHPTNDRSTQLQLFTPILSKFIISLGQLIIIPRRVLRKKSIPASRKMIKSSGQREHLVQSERAVVRSSNPDNSTARSSCVMLVYR